MDTSPHDLRQSLADAIGKRDALRREFGGIKDAQDRVQSTIFELRTKLQAAEASFEQARQTSVTYLVDEALGQATEARPSLRQMRSDLAVVEDELAAARDAKAVLTDRQKAVESKLSWAKSEVRSALSAVVQGSLEVTKLLEEAKALEAQLIERMAQIAYLVGAGVLFPGVYDPFTLHPFGNHLIPCPTPGQSWAFLLEKEGRRENPEWHAALTALDVDAQTPLPSGVTASASGKGGLRKILGGR